MVLLSIHMLKLSDDDIVPLKKQPCLYNFSRLHNLRGWREQSYTRQGTSIQGNMVGGGYNKRIRRYMFLPALARFP
jgi:hypothetical protein